MAEAAHVVSFEEFRAVRERRQARPQPEPPPVAALLRSPFQAGRTLTPREVEHRRRMLTHLSGVPASGGRAVSG